MQQCKKASLAGCTAFMSSHHHDSKFLHCALLHADDVVLSLYGFTPTNTEYPFL